MAWPYIQMEILNTYLSAYLKDDDISLRDLLMATNAQ